MPHAAPPPPAPAPPVPVFGPLTGLLSEQSTPLGIFLALARLGMSLLSRFLPSMATLARSYPRHWQAFLDCSIALLRVLLTVRFAPECFTISQFRRLWRARQLIESLAGAPLPCFHSSSLGARTPSSANATSNQSPSASTANAPTPGTPISRLASSPASSNPQPHPPQPRTPGTPSIPQVPCCSLSPDRSRSDAHSSSQSRSRSKKRAPASLQSIIAMMEASQTNPQTSSPHSALRAPHSSSLPPFIPDVATLHAALKADTLPPNCAGALLDKPADTLVKALQQVHALIQAFPQLSPTQSPSPSPSPSDDSSVGSVRSVVSGLPQSEISNFKSEIPGRYSPSPSEKAQWAFETAFPIPHSTSPP